MKSLKILASVAVLTTLTACGGSNVKLVKNYTFNALKSMPVGTAIDGSPLCKKVKWKDESTKEQKFVSASCSMNDELVKEYFDRNSKIFQQFKENTEERKDKHIKYLEATYKKMASENTPEFSQEKMIAAANNACKINDQKRIKCDKEVFRKEFNLKEDDKNMWSGNHLDYSTDDYLETLFNLGNIDTQLCGSYGFHSQCVQVPKMPQELQTKITFVINTDKTVDVFKGEIIDDGKVVESKDNKDRNIGHQEIRDILNGEFLEKFYERK